MIETLVIAVMAFSLQSSAATRRAPVGAAVFTPDHRIFNGCRKSFSACVRSCPDRRALGETDSDRCDPRSIKGPVACYCLFHGQT